MGLSVPGCSYGHYTESDMSHPQSPAVTVTAGTTPWPPLGLGLHLGPIVPTRAFFSRSWMEGVTASIHLPGQLVPHPQGAPEQPQQPQYILGPWKKQNPL